MLFQTQGFVLVFLPATLAFYWLLAKHAAARQWALIAASLAFYAMWDARFLPLLLGQITATWFLAGIAGERKWPLALGIVLNLASLGTFKYLNFLVDTLGAVLQVSLPQADLILPIGISFFSFQLIAYLVDRMRDQVPLYEWRRFALVVLLFPHLIAGPIVRHVELASQFDLNPYRPGLARRMATGGLLFTLGLAKKVLLADALASVVDPIFARSTTLSPDFGAAWTAALGFSFQLFLDFSAYTEMAIGIALMFGFLLPENFRRPYLASDIRDFWRRWHISLSNFIRDYLYIPLGGSRSGWGRYVAATLVSMGLCGLWHGAGWTYVGWGLWHGVGLVLHRAWTLLGRPLPRPAGWAVTMLFVLIGWVLFRSSSFENAFGMLQAMAGLNGFGGSIKAAPLLVAAALVSVLVPSAYELKSHWILSSPMLSAAAATVAVWCLLVVGAGAPVNFIYFQF